MKGKFITLVLTLGFLAAFGVFMHSPPSILDGLTGATPKAKRAAQMAAPLEGNYLFCINPALEPFSDADFRNDLKAFVSGETEVLSDAGLPHMTLSVCETDYPLLCYATALCERLTAAGADVTLKQYSETMLRSRPAIRTASGIDLLSVCSVAAAWRSARTLTRTVNLLELFCPSTLTVF